MIKKNLRFIKKLLRLLLNLIMLLIKDYIIIIKISKKIPLLKIRFVSSYLAKNLGKLNIGCMKKGIKRLKINFLIDFLKKQEKLIVPLIDHFILILINKLKLRNKLQAKSNLFKKPIIQVVNQILM
jgi:hypothetical protein